MLETPGQVIWCLLTYTDWWQPSSASVMQVGAARRSAGESDGIRPGLLDTLDERTELCRRVAALDDRLRRILFLWYVAQMPVTDIARQIGVSPRQCQRLRARAVDQVVELGRDGDEAVA